jgi:hypothetical protein
MINRNSQPMKMKTRYSFQGFLAIGGCLAMCAAAAQAAVVSLSPGTINAGSTTTASFSNADVTITPLVGGVASTFNGPPTTTLAQSNARLGIDGTGTNNNAFNDPDLIAGNANDETLRLAFQPTVGLTGLTWDYARADGPLATDGIRITGFLFDPTATLTGPGTFGLSYSSGTLAFQLSALAFVDTDGVLTLNGAASAGQTLNILVNDSTQTGAQLPITSITYDNAVPEPSTALLGGLGLLALLRRRR